MNLTTIPPAPVALKVGSEELVSPACQRKSSVKIAKSSSIKKEKSKTGKKTFNLHRYLAKRDWEKASDLLDKMKRSKDKEAVDDAYAVRNKDEETLAHIVAWKAPPSFAVDLLEAIPVEKRSYYLMRTDVKGNTPLHLACANAKRSDMSFTTLRTLLLMCPKALEMTNSVGDTPLHLLVASEAFQRGDSFEAELAAEEAIVSLLEVRNGLAATQNDQGLTLLHAAIANAAHERVLVKLLVHEPAAAKLTDVRGFLPLHYVSTFSGIPWTFTNSLIWAHPESLTTKNDDGETPLHLLIRNVSKYVDENQFVDRNTTKLAEVLLGEKSTPLMVFNDEYHTPLHYVALYRTPPQLLRVLTNATLYETASAITTSTGATPLHYLCASSDICVETLMALATPSSCATRNSLDRTPLMVAATNPNISSKILSRLCEIYPQGTQDTSTSHQIPLQLSIGCREAKTSVIKALVKADPATVSHMNSNGDTALHDACFYRRDRSVIELMVDLNPDARFCTNFDGLYPFEIAVALGMKKEILRVLSASPASVNKKRKKKKTSKSIRNMTEEAPRVSSGSSDEDPSNISGAASNNKDVVARPVQGKKTKKISKRRLIQDLIDESD